MNADIAVILDRHGTSRTELIDLLWDIQRSFGHIPAPAVHAVAEWMGLSPEDVLETASFYHFFHTKPSGRYRIYLSDTAVARTRGYRQVYDALEHHTGARFNGPPTADFGLFETSCIGMSDHEPAMLIDDV
jgi:[NiFe] hydrogenase diaphorase moiety large subunit